MNAPLLLVEPDDLLRGSLGRALRSEGFDVVAVSDGAEGLQRLNEGHVFMIMMDVDSPDRDGWADAQELASVRRFRPMVVITAKTGQERRAARAGADTLMEKPLSFPLLVDTIKSLLDKSLQAQVEPMKAVFLPGVAVSPGRLPELSLGTA
jgi:DNA-binding response OmpR family regulator